MIKIIYVTICFLCLLIGFLVCGLLVDKKITFVETINAEKEVIWNLWTQVDKWSAWDPDIKDASIEGDFVVGAKGHIILNDNARVKYHISHVEKDKIWHAVTGNHLWQMVFVQELYGSKPYTVLHEIRYTGLLGIIPYLKTRRWMNKNLPEGLRLLKEMSEERK